MLGPARQQKIVNLVLSEFITAMMMFDYSLIFHLFSS